MRGAAGCAGQQPFTLLLVSLARLTQLCQLCQHTLPARSAEELRGVLESGPLATGSGRLSERIGSAQVSTASAQLAAVMLLQCAAQLPLQSGALGQPQGLRQSMSAHSWV